MAAAIPDDDHMAAKMLEKMAKELCRSRAVLARVGNGFKEEVGSTTFGRKSDGGNRRHLLPVAAVLLEDGSLATWG